MAVTAQWYPQGFGAFANAGVDWDTDTIKLALMGTGYTFNDTHDFWDDISANDYGSSTGYTAGGSTIANRAITETDSSALTARANTTAYVIGDLVRTATDSTRVFLAVVAGTSAGSEPGGMATLGSLREITDGSVVWVNVGRAVTILDGDPVSWTGLDQDGTLAAVIWKDTGTPGTSPLLGAIHFGATETPTDLTVTPPAGGYLLIPSGAAL
jgi:hypothetical protein